VIINGNLYKEGDTSLEGFRIDRVSLITGCVYKTKKNTTDYQEVTLKSERSIKITPIQNKKKYLPPVIKRKANLKKVDIFEGKFFTFSANNAPLMTVLYAISKDTGRCAWSFPGRRNRWCRWSRNRRRWSRWGAGGGLGGGFSGGGVAAGLSGNYTVQYQTPQESLDFFTQLEDNISSFLSENGKYTLNKLTGILIVTDKKRNIELIDNYIKKLKKEIQKQVLIEAKIVEVELSDEYQFGVDRHFLLKMEQVHFQ